MGSICFILVFWFVSIYKFFVFRFGVSFNLLAGEDDQRGRLVREDDRKGSIRRKRWGWLMCCTYVVNSSNHWDQASNLL